MALPLGVAANSSESSPEHRALWSSLRAAKNVKSPWKTDKRRGQKSATDKEKVLKKFSKDSAVRKRTRGSSNPTATCAQTAVEERPASTPAGSPEPAQVFELAETAPRGKSVTRPKHIPIVIPIYTSLSRTSPVNDSRNGSFLTFLTHSGSDRSLSVSSGQSPRTPISASAPERPRHVEIKIPSWAEPVIKQPNTPPRVHLTNSTFIDPFLDLTVPSPPPDMSRPTPDSSRANTMDSTISAPSPTGMYAPSRKGSVAYLSSTHSSQSSLVGMRAEYESASEAESMHNDTRSHSRATAHNMGGLSGPSQSSPVYTAGQSGGSAGLSGLVCNVHRTTGREPHPLVGATTTVLGDKLYVFGGRRLSRTKPQMTSNLYELDLIRRHWTKLDAKGDIPPPRYFHSVCSLGDTKLVCYGGMSPNPNADPSTDSQTDILVMSDIHIYDVPTNTWMKIATTDSPQGRYAHCTSILPSSAVFASPNAPMSAVHHNPAGNNPNQGSLGVSLDGRGGAEMIVVGGQDSANHYIEQISVFNLRSLRWTGTFGMGRSCGAYRSVVAPLTTMSADQVGAGPHATKDPDDDEEEPSEGLSGAPMLIYSNYNFLDVKLELQIRLTDGHLIEKPMRTEVSPPGLRFPNGGIIDNHFVVSGTYLTSSKQEYALWALDLRTLTWSRIDASNNVFSQGSWNRGVLWSRRNTFVILGNRKRNLVDDYNNRRINFSNVCLVELEAFGLYDNPRTVEPASSFVSASANLAQMTSEWTLAGRHLSSAADGLGAMMLNVRELSDMDFLAIDGTRIPVNSRLIARRWGPSFTQLLRESLMAGTDTDTATLRPTVASHPSRNSSITITPSITSSATTLTNNIAGDIPDARSVPPSLRPRLLYLPHTAPTLQALLHFLYTSSLPLPPSPLATPQIYCSLLQLARPYKVDGLLEATVQRLHETLDGRNAVAIFNAAAMAAGGGDGVQFAASNNGRSRESTIPIRGASLANFDGLAGLNGAGRPGSNSLRIDTDMANGRSTRNTLRPGQSFDDGTDDENDGRGDRSAGGYDSMSESDVSLSARSLTGRAERERIIWNGSLSAVVGLQKRGLRGLMEGRRMKERTGGPENARIGLGIAATAV